MGPAIAQSCLDLIGNTPVVHLNRIPGQNDAEVFHAEGV